MNTFFGDTMYIQFCRRMGRVLGKFTCSDLYHVKKEMTGAMGRQIEYRRTELMVWIKFGRNERLRSDW